MTYRRPWLALIAAMAPALSPPPDLPAAPPPPTSQSANSKPDPFSETVAQLGSSDPAAREEATRLLWNAGLLAAPALRRAAAGGNDTEPEVAARATALLEKIESGVRPDTPQKALDLVVRYKTNPDADLRVGAALGLIELGDSAAPLLLRLWANEPDAAVKARVLQAMQVSCPRYARLLIADGDDATAEQLLAAAAEARGGPSTIDYAAYLAARGRLRWQIDAWARAKDLPPARRRVLGWLRLADGDTDAAAEVAREVADDALLRAAEYAAGDWKPLAEALRAAAPQAETSVNENGLAAALSHMAGDVAHTDAGLKRLAELAGQKPQYAFICAETFFAVGRPGEAIDLLTARDPVSASAFLCFQLRFDEAFALAARAAAADAPHTAWVRVAAARQYAALGEREKARTELAAALASAAAQGPQALAQAAAAAVEVEDALGLRDAAIDRALAPADETSRAALVARLFPSRAGDARFWWNALRSGAKDEPPRATFDRLSALLGRKAGPEQVRAWCDAAAEAALAGPEPYARRLGVVTVFETLRAYDLDQPATELLERAARSAGDAPDALLRLGDVAAQAGRFDDAAAYYERSRSRAPRGQAEAALAAYLQGWAAEKAGRAAEGQALIALARALLLGDDAARAALCDGLEKRGLRREAADEGVVQARLSGVWSFAAADAARRSAIRAAEAQDYGDAADGLSRWLLRVVRQESGFSRQEGYLSVPRDVECFRALARLPKSKSAAAPNTDNEVPRPDAAPADVAPDKDAAPEEQAVAEVLRRLVSVYPADTDWTIRCVAQFDRRGRRDLGDALFAENARLLDAVCERYPDAALYHNSVAWLSARCGRRLDAALVHANRAVALRPGNAAFLDTLAETFFRRGETARAIDVMKHCLELEAGSAYFAAQMKRFGAQGNRR